MKQLTLCVALSLMLGSCATPKTAEHFSSSPMLVDVDVRLPGKRGAYSFMLEQGRICDLSASLDKPYYSIPRRKLDLQQAKRIHSLALACVNGAPRTNRWASIGLEPDAPRHSTWEWQVAISIPGWDHGIEYKVWATDALENYPRLKRLLVEVAKCFPEELRKGLLP